MKLIILISLIFLNFISIGKVESSKKRTELADFEVKSGNENEKKLKEIFWEKHWGAIADACGKGVAKYVIGGRETGALSIARIAQGAKPKPHTILEKSIKNSSIPDLDKQPWKDKLQGFVGHYDKDKKLIGLRTDGLKDNPNVQNIKEGGSFISIEEAIKLLDTPELQSKNAHMFYTGDYDLHEIYDGSNKIIPEATKEKITLLNLLNAKIAAVDNKRTGKFKLENNLITFDDSEEHQYAMFQHGDQSTYKMNQHLEAAKEGEKKAELVAAVVNESNEPIGWNVRGTWYVTLNKEEHWILRSALKLVPPAHWAKDMKKGDEGLTYKVNRKARTNKKLK